MSLDPRVVVKPRHMPWPAVPEISVLRFIDRPDACPMKPHVHPGQVEITYLVRGHISWRSAGRRLDVSGGDVHVSFPGEPHGGDNNIFEPMTFYSLSLNIPEAAERLLGLTGEESRAVTDDLRRLPRQFRAQPTLLGRFKDALEAASAPQSPLHAAALRCSVVILLIEIIASARQARGLSHSSQPVAQALELMRNNLSEVLTLEELAEAVGWSVSHFKARFRQETGATPAKEYLRLRVLEAVDRIAHGAESTTAVAYALGFPSSQYLATCVRRITGRPPSAFRTKSKRKAQCRASRRR